MRATVRMRTLNDGTRGRPMFVVIVVIVVPVVLLVGPLLLERLERRIGGTR
jgi:hypothetical protein